ncbi:unnamed protein product [marine sediment metagenome]|uniref:Uncharacterized protein n=1 Tax=marine sediment metagenome TaxID=412755 RepID=X1C4N5_9ZZZZ
MSGYVIKTEQKKGYKVRHMKRKVYVPESNPGDVNEIARGRLDSKSKLSHPNFDSLIRGKITKGKVKSVRGGTTTYVYA